MISKYLSDRRLDRVEIERAILAVVPICSLRAECHVIPKVETWKDVVATRRRNAIEAEFSGRRLTVLITKQTELIPTDANIEDKVRRDRRSIVRIKPVVASILKSARDLIRCAFEIITILSVSAVVILSKHAIVRIEVMVDLDHI